MLVERREMWRDGDWRCEWWTADGHQRVRLFLGHFLVSELGDGPNLDLTRQVREWREAARADRRRNGGVDSPLTAPLLR